MQPRRERPDPAAGTTSASHTALAALAFAVEAVEGYLGPSSEGRWALVSLLCAGRLLANTNCPYPEHDLTGSPRRRRRDVGELFVKTATHSALAGQTSRRR